MYNMLIGVITSTLSSYPPEVRRGATSGLQRKCFKVLESPWNSTSLWHLSVTLGPACAAASAAPAVTQSKVHMSCGFVFKDRGYNMVKPIFTGSFWWILVMLYNVIPPHVHGLSWFIVVYHDFVIISSMKGPNIVVNSPNCSHTHVWFETEVLPNYVLLPPSGVLLFVPDHTVEAFYMTKTWSWKPSFMNLNYENLREQR